MALLLSFKTVTWYKDSHSLFDYESTNTGSNTYDMTLSEKHVGIFRKKNSTDTFLTSNPETVDTEDYELISYINLKNDESTNGYKLEFSGSKNEKNKAQKNEKFNTDEENSSNDIKEEPFIVVSRLKDSGSILNVGQVVKLGRVQYFVSEISFGGIMNSAVSKHKIAMCNRNSMKFTPELANIERNNCKICLEDTHSEEDFLFNPCKCIGSCGSVHIKCLQHWIKIKVKKETIGGTTHFNFQRFECEVCKSELPIQIDTGSKQIELLPIEKPPTNYIILESACDKVKSVMLIQNPSHAGIKLGRGHDCEIRITDISVSRNHALIKENSNGFFIYDNKSKFGTLVRNEHNFNVYVGNSEKTFQIGRTLVEVQMKPSSGQKHF